MINVKTAKALGLTISQSLLLRVDQVIPLDPSQKLRRKLDVGIKYGQIAALAPSIPADRGGQRIDATGKLVTPGLIDLHTH